MIEIQNILPSDLEEAFSSIAYEEEGSIKVQSINFNDENSIVDFTIKNGYSDENETQNWQMQIFGYRTSKIDLENLGDQFYFYSDHFLLWEFIDKETELYFKKSSDNPEKLLVDIYNLHNYAFDNLIPVSKFINSYDVVSIGEAESGLFAKGPKQLLHYYYNILAKNNKEPYFYGDYEPMIWDGEKFNPEEKNLKLALIGETYFIGKDIKFNRLI